MKVLVAAFCALIGTVTGALAFVLMATQGPQTVLSTSISCGVSCVFTPGTASAVGALATLMSPVYPPFTGTWSLQTTGTVNGQTCDNSGFFSIDINGNLNVTAGAFAGTYNLCYVATQPRTLGSPFANVASVTGAVGTFPITVSSSQRYLQTVSGRPFLMIADSAQALVVVPLCSGAGVVVGGYTCPSQDPSWSSENNISNYLQTRASQGFNTIQFDVLCDNYIGCPSNGSGVSTAVDAGGNVPFLNSGTSVSTYLFGASPCANCNPVYWSRIDAIINLAAQNNLFVLLNPTPTQQCGAGTLWNMFSNASNSATGTGFGTFLGNRYKSISNVGWHHTNDYTCYTTAASDQLIANIVAGIKGAGDTHVVTMEIGLGGNTSLDNQTQNPTHGWGAAGSGSPPGPYLSVNGAYHFYIPVAAAGDPSLSYAYGQTPTMPAIEVEANYEGENGSGAAGCNGAQPPGPQACSNQLMRKQFWGVFTTGGVGDIYGAHCVWSMAQPANPGTGCTGGDGTGWPNYMSLPGEQQFIYTKNFLSQYNWQLLVPDSTNTFLTAGAGTACTGSTTLSACARATAAVASDGSFALVYVPAAQNAVTLNLGRLMTNTGTTAVFYDPTTASTTGAGTTNPCPVATPCSVTNGVTNSKAFANTALNTDGDSTWSHDWVLLVSAGPPPTPTITGVALSSNTFTCGVAGTVGAVTVQGVNNAAATLSLTGADAAQFSLSSTTVPSNLTVGTSPAGCPRTYNINIVATLSGAGGSCGSPCSQAESIVAAQQTIASISPTTGSFVSGGGTGQTAATMSATMSPASPTFSAGGGTWALVASGGACSGGDTTDFAIGSATGIITNSTTTAGTYTLCVRATASVASNSPQFQTVTVTGAASLAEAPGPSFALWNAPWYNCNQNWYVATNGSDSRTSAQAQSPSTPWLTLQHAADASTRAGTGSWCINVAAGTYSAGATTPSTEGGTTMSTAGFLVFRCSAPGSDHNGGFVTQFTGSGCVVTDSSAGAFCTATNCTTTPGNYVIYDGFTLNSATSPQSQFSVGVSSGQNKGSSPVTQGHHIMSINNVITGYGQSGIQLNDSEYFYVLHNRIFTNSANPGCDGGAQGSGISLAGVTPVSPYTETADDLGNNQPADAKIGIYSGNTTHNHIHNYVLYNQTYINHVAGCGSGATDGNGVTFDTNDAGDNNVQYPLNGPNQPNYILAAFNVAYNNGGGGFHIQNSSYVILANNTCYQNWLDPNANKSGQNPPCIDGQRGVNYFPGNNIFLNNISVMDNASYTLSTPTAITIANGSFNGLDGFWNGAAIGGTACPSINGTTECGGSNVTFVKGYTGPPGYNTGSGQTEIALNNGNQGFTYSCTVNKCSTDPKWIAVDTTGGSTGSLGNFNTPPTGSNFALQSTSPARGFVATRPYLPGWVRDAGACDRSFTTCP